MDDYQEQSSFSFESSESEEVIKEIKGNYHKAICDSCDFPIFGVRFKCLNCEDYDLCDICEKQQEQNSKLHDPTHCFLKINYPMDKRYLLTKEPLIKEATYNQERSILHVGCLCDNCKGPIVGARFVCTNCDELFNLCEECEIKSLTEKIHDKYHVMVKIPYSHIDLPNDCIVEVSHEELKKISVPKMPLLYEIKENANIQISKDRLELRSDNALKLGKKKRVTLHNHFSDKKIRKIDKGDVDALLQIEEESFARPYDITFFQNMVYLSENKRNIGLWVVELKVNEKTEDKVNKKKDNKFVKFFKNIFTKSTEDLDTPSNTCIGGYIAVKVKNYNAEIISLAVSKKCRGNGLGLFLMEHAEKFARDCYADSCSLHVSVYNKIAQELYKKCGYEIKNWIKNYYSNEEEDGLVMILDLSSKKCNDKFIN